MNNSGKSFHCIRSLLPIVMLMLGCVLPVAAQTVPGAAAPRTSEVMTNDGPLKSKLDDQSFAENATAAGLAEVEMAKLAKTKSHNEKILEFADIMLRDHQAANAKLKQIAAQLQLKLPSSLNGDQQNLLDELKTKSGDAFDRLYVDIMRKEHDTAVGLFDNAAGEIKLNKQLRAFATETLIKLREHQRRAHGLTN